MFKPDDLEPKYKPRPIQHQRQQIQETIHKPKQRQYNGNGVTFEVSISLLIRAVFIHWIESSKMNDYFHKKDPLFKARSSYIKHQLVLLFYKFFLHMTKELKQNRTKIKCLIFFMLTIKHVVNLIDLIKEKGRVIFAG